MQLRCDTQNDVPWLLLEQQLSAQSISQVIVNIFNLESHSHLAVVEL